jgi:hypothetical protein
MSERDEDDRKRLELRRTRQTSLEAYDEIKESGTLSRVRWTVYDYLYSFGPSTGMECFKGIGLETNQSGRFTELRDQGFIREVGTLVCKITGREVIGWDVTSRTEPLAPDDGPSRADHLEALLRTAVGDLRRQGDLFSARIARTLEDELEKLADGGGDPRLPRGRGVAERGGIEG